MADKLEVVISGVVEPDQSSLKAVQEAVNKMPLDPIKVKMELDTASSASMQKQIENTVKRAAGNIKFSTLKTPILSSILGTDRLAAQAKTASSAITAAMKKMSTVNFAVSDKKGLRAQLANMGVSKADISAIVKQFEQGGMRIEKARAEFAQRVQSHGTGKRKTYSLTEQQYLKSLVLGGRTADGVDAVKTIDWNRQANAYSSKLSLGMSMDNTGGTVKAAAVKTAKQIAEAAQVRQAAFDQYRLKTEAMQAALKSVGGGNSAASANLQTAFSGLEKAFKGNDIGAFNAQLKTMGVALAEGAAAKKSFDAAIKSAAALQKVKADAQNAAQGIDKLRASWTKMSSTDKLKLDGIGDMFAKATNAGEITKATAALRSFKTEMTLAGKTQRSFGDQLGHMVGKFSGWFSISQVIMSAVRGVKNMFTAVKDIDAGMTSLKKVTDETTASYDAFLAKSKTRSKDLAIFVPDYVQGATNFSRLGYELRDASKLGEWANIYANVGDGVESVDAASSSLVSTLKAFKIEAKDVNTVVDRFNIVGKMLPNGAVMRRR